MKKAQSLIEYTLILILISLIAITTLHYLGKKFTFKNKKPYKITIQQTMSNYCSQNGLKYNTKLDKCE